MEADEILRSYELIIIFLYVALLNTLHKIN